ncbi:DUF3267 domain-containing protein [Caproiciproducens galactitolivorans]|uniref:DUF3267 domain-containing protein n=1 Tax=Caproiciproducens galactitolivorans TaxID=642589 RepID=A0ABT4BWY1_9FIRM|nr:DUF3267 domain-containing protein [Caproiciproducens galactitolivorans]MCY1715305.1 DUF3267 domain-containing protein [Caproiciproducens galactitolivorans]
MKYTKKIPSEDEERSKKLAAEGWKKLKEPPNLATATLLSLPFAFLNGLIVMGIGYALYPPLREFFRAGNNGYSIAFTVNLYTLLYIVALYLFTVLHEFLHAFFIPNALKSDHVFWGINGLFGFVYTTEKIKKGRYLVITIMPFLLLSVLLPFVLSFFGWLNGYTIFLCLVNAMGSCVDCLNLCFVAVQVPKGAYLVNNGSKTFFKE